MCHKIRLFNFHFKVLIKYDNSKNSAKYHKIFMSTFWEIVFCEPLHFSPPCLLSNLKHAPSREYPLTARKTVSERVPDAIVFFNPIILPWCRWSFFFGISLPGPVHTLKSRIPTLNKVRIPNPAKLPLIGNTQVKCLKSPNYLLWPFKKDVK